MLRQSIVAVFAILLLNVRGDAEESHSLCYVLDHLRELEGRIISIRGQIQSGFETTLLADPNCISGPQTNGYVWDAKISLGSLHPLVKRSDREASDLVSFWRIVKASRDRTNPRGITYVSALVSGVLHSRSDLWAVKGAMGWLLNGFGHLNKYPAEMDLKTVRDYTILSGVSPDK